MSEYVPLVQLLEGFMGPRYRQLGGIFPPIFVRSEIYGDKDNSENAKERDLRRRIWDYKLMTYNNWETGQTTHMLPNPFNKGDGWYDEVFERWKEFENLGWTQDMLDYWRINIKQTYAAEVLFNRDYNGVFWLFIQ
jgi:hypothetical protein